MVAGMRQRRAARRASAAAGQDGAGGHGPTAGPAGPGGTLTSFRPGLDTLVDALARAAGDSLRLRAPVAAIRDSDDGHPPDHGVEAGLRPAPGRAGWIVRTGAGDDVHADVVVVAVPSPRAAPLLEPMDPVLGLAVREIETASLAVVALGYRVEDVPDVHGFGFLVPRGMGPRILGCLWDSSIFPGRAPAGHVLLRTMIGGAHDPEAVGMERDALLALVATDLRATMGLRAAPALARIYRWPLGIAQYRVGHQDRLDRIQARLDRQPGLWLAGSSFYGISMNACFDKAPEQADQIVAFLSR
jgi:protoporphyrinogen/coproporphyrinogen III oxidase